MDKVAVAAVAAVAGGALIALQAPINAELGESVGTIAAAAINFAVGTSVLIALALAIGGFSDLSEARSVPWYYVFGGGVLGAVFVAVALVTVRPLSAAGVTAATLAGQLTASILIDRAGILGLSERAITFERVLGVAFLTLGMVLIIRD